MIKQNLLLSASAIALLAALSTASMSQSPSGPSPGGAQEQQRTTPSGTEKDRGAGTTEQPKTKGGSAQQDPAPQPKASDRAEDKASPKSRVQGQDGTPKASERAQEKSSPKSAVQGQKKDDDDDRRSRAAGDKAKDSPKQSNQGQAKDRDRASGDESKDKRGDRAGSGESKDSPTQSGKEPGKDQDRAAGDRTKDREDRQRGDRAEGDRGSGERVQLSEQKRTSVRERMSKSAGSNRVTSVNFDVRVGVNVPRNTTLHVLPSDVVEIVPEYRGYRYVYVRDEIIIIHPTDYVVVAVIGGDNRVGSRSGSRITLATDDRVFVRRHVDLGARVRLGIGSISIGMNLPDSVELRPLPTVIVERYPDLRDHRYFIYEQDVVIVDPRSREVVLVIED